ncbi:MAG: ABC transporter substrate-binding protein [Burkholderiaceae bacterium]|jgi:ABC-type branched-subunit amino acid transport system substrate-binding protein|nr:ABC transporter substrate-binding protein [Burkholderiaceae bacterium]
MKPRLLTLSLHRHLTGLALLAVASLALAQGVSPRQILIGQSITLQGGKNEYGTAVVDGIHAHLQDVNARGGVNGRQIVLKTLDDDNKGGQAEANARALIEQDKVFIVFGSIEGGPSNAVMKATNELQVPFFGPMAGSPTLRRPHQPLVFPVRAEHRDEFRMLLEYIRNTGGKRVAFFRADSEVGLQHLENFKRLCQELALDLPFKSDVSDAQLSAMAGRIAAANLHGVINHGSVGVYEKLIRQTRALGSPAPFMAVNSGSTQLARHLGEMAHGMLFAQVVPSPWERKTELTREYQEAFRRHKPGVDFSYGSLEGYLTAKALVAALRLAGPNPTRESFVQGILKTGVIDVKGLRLLYQPGDHTGLKLVDLAIYSRDNRFRH